MSSTIADWVNGGIGGQSGGGLNPSIQTVQLSTAPEHSKQGSTQYGHDGSSTSKDP